MQNNQTIAPAAISQGHPDLEVEQETVFSRRTSRTLFVWVSPAEAKHRLQGHRRYFLDGGPALRTCWLDYMLVVWLIAQAPNESATEQRAVNALAQLLKRHRAQSEKLAMHNGKDVKERECDDFYPQQRQHRHRLVMSAMGQVPVLS